MGLFSGLKTWLANRSLRRQYRYPAMAAANRILLLLENEVADFTAMSAIMEEYKKAQGIKESERDLAYIRIYFELEQFLVSHQPPVIKRALTVSQIRDIVRQTVDVNQLGEYFRLVFLPENQQADRLLKIGAMELLRFLVTSLGQSQLLVVIHQSVGATPLGEIKITDDGISFEAVNARFAKLSTQEVLAAYTGLYAALYTEAKNLFGENTAKEVVGQAAQKIKGYYPDGMVSVFLNALPPEARP